MADPQDLLDGLEPQADLPRLSTTEAALISAAISLKRIADTLGSQNARQITSGFTHGQLRGDI